MKKSIAILWLLICLFPAWGRAEGLTVGPAEEPASLMSSGDCEPSRCDPGLSENKARDEELLQIVGHGLDALPPRLAEFPPKMEVASSRIKLWDEADRGVQKLDISGGRGLLQSITLSGRGSK